MIEQERAAMRGDPEKEIKAWSDKLTEVDQERRGYLRQNARGVLSDEELDEVLADLEETRKTAERALQALRSRQEMLAQLERDKDAILESYARMTPEALDNLTPEERRSVYHMLRLKVNANPDGSLEVTGVLRDCFASENQRQGIVLTKYQVELTVAGAVVPRDERVTAVLKVLQGEVLTPAPGGATLQGPTPA